MFFKDWRLLDQSSVGLSLHKDYLYYIHSRAWALKGWLGGTHSWIAFYSNDQWLVLELTDRETIEVQNANLLYAWSDVGYQEHSPTISNRIPDAKWFGSTPIIVASTLNNFKYEEIVTICKNYPVKEFKLVTQNCNTFISYVIYKLGLKIKKPLRSFGFKNKFYWTSVD
jgi:hypothetical protein